MIPYLLEKHLFWYYFYYSKSQPICFTSYNYYWNYFLQLYLHVLLIWNSQFLKRRKVVEQGMSKKMKKKQKQKSW